MSSETPADTGTQEAASAPRGQASETRQYVTFMAGDEVFAVEMAPVQEIIRVPEVVRVPLSPPTLEGLANLRGKVLPIVSLRRALGFADRVADDTSRAVIIDLGQPMGFVVDRVASVVGVDADQIEDVSGIRGTVNTELLSGLIKDVGGHAMVMVLNFEKLIAQEFADLGQSALRQGGLVSASLGQGSDRQGHTSEEELHLVSFAVAGQEYAIAIEDVQEIVQVPEQIVQVPHAQSHVLGVMTLRQRLLPLVSLRRMFALADQSANEQSRIVVVSIRGASVGIVVDNVNEVLRVPQRLVESMPGLLARDGDMADITDICRLADDQRLVSIVSTDNLFRHSAIQEALSAVTQQDNPQRSSDTGPGGLSGDEEQVVVFRLGTEEFGVPIDSVQEIVRVPEVLTHVPKAPTAVEGVINLRGSVLPVIDLRRRLGLPTVERNDGQRIMVFLIQDVRTGFIVDAVAEVLKVPRHAIEPAPHLSHEQATLLARMANLEKQKRMLQLLDPKHLLAAGELSSMAAMAA